jgi:hypothetical protein
VISNVAVNGVGRRAVAAAPLALAPVTGTAGLVIGIVGVAVAVVSVVIAYTQSRDNRRFHNENRRREEQHREDQRRLEEQHQERIQRKALHQAEINSAEANFTKLHRVCIQVIEGGVPLTLAEMERFGLTDVCWELRRIGDRIPNLQAAFVATADAAMELSRTGLNDTAAGLLNAVKAGELAIAQYKAALAARACLDAAHAAMAAEWGV